MPYLKGDFQITISLFVFALVTCASAFTALLISQYIAFNVLPLSIQEANAIKHKTSIASQAPPSSNEGNTIPSSPPGCISYNTSTRTISVSCHLHPDLRISITSSMISCLPLNNLQVVYGY